MNPRFSLLCLLFIGLSVSFSCSEPPVESSPTLVEVAPVEQTSLRRTYPFSGTVRALEEIEIRGDVAGYITAIFVEDGARVRKGDRLFEIDQSRYQAGEAVAEANLAIAKETLNRVQKDFKRYEELKEAEAIATQLYDDARIALRQAELEVEAATAALRTAQTDRAYANIRAPFTGTVGFSEVRLGTLVRPGETLLTRLSSDDPIGVDIYPDAALLPLMMQWKEAGEAIGLLRLGDQNYPEKGRISTIDRAVDERTGTIRVRLLVPNPEYRLKPGLPLKVQVPEFEERSQLRIPLTAVKEQMGEFSVFVLQEDRTVREQKIKRSFQAEGYMIIEEGLTEGQKVVVSGVQKLRSGDPVRIKEEEAA
ncbi:RND family efflux transporter MFP subunit [Nitritalea halalkaliphila LW7]|uniref:RND family efflux transporter MFP subunit n=1 Tax=Nitritalea halalkaliphila LW7 TaxID=1189621 RepID=I5C370_9BACT|nr:efflux RND transporter periplasmic adaptor subunit [Nitritalea halalkaliphila]EIM76272.1 RND family efflux transporter MFP subunit [Nitritalea halalkaliphila LW7]